MVAQLPPPKFMALTRKLILIQVQEMFLNYRGQRQL